MTEAQAKEVIKQSIGKALLSAAMSHEQRLEYHAKTVLSESQLSGWHSHFLAWVKSLLPADKYQIFRKLLRTPLPTVALTAEIFEALSKVFDARDSRASYQYNDKAQLEDWLEYKEKVAPKGVWETRGFEAMKTGINSILVVDMPQVPTEPPTPYFYFLKVDKVRAVGTDEFTGEIHWLAFDAGEQQVAFIDNEAYRVFEEGENNELTLTHEAAHTLGRCPARWFWSDPISWDNPALKSSPITEQLDNLDRLLFFETSKRHLDLYAPYPIYSAFATDCDFKDEQSGQYCDGGFLFARDGQPVYVGAELLACPKCSAHRLTGVGSFVEIDPPGPHNDNADLRNPVQILTIDRASLDYNVAEVERIKENIFTSVTGSSIEVIRNQAINKDQVASFFEARKAALIRLKRNFEKAQEWVETTICELRYGRGFGKISISYGTEFYLLSADDLWEIYQKAKNEGSDQITLDALQDQYLETLWRNAPAQMQRARIMLDIDTLRHTTTDEARYMLERGIVSSEDYHLKQNLSTLVSEFEMTHGPITDYKPTSSYKSRIDEIRSWIINFIKTKTQQNEQ